MWFCNKKESNEIQDMLEREIMNRDKRIAYLESRIRGIQHQALNVTNVPGECCYNIKGPDGKFNIFHLPFIK
jgi:hypothetical protein